MKVLVLNGLNPEQLEYNHFRVLLCKSFISNDCDFEIIDLHSKKINTCRGCFNCWVQKPGECFIEDDSQHINKQIISCDLLVFLTPVVYGGYSSQLKIMLDRIIPLISPFFAKYNGEVHHKPRYKKYPSLLGVGIQNYLSTDEAACFKQVIYRNSLNLHSPAVHAETFMVTDNETTILTKFKENILIMEGFYYAK